MNTASQREAVARLTTYCERMIARGKLPTLDELNLRHFVDQTCAAFDMAPTLPDQFEQDLQLIREAMAS